MVARRVWEGGVRGMIGWGLIGSMMSLWSRGRFLLSE
jgi:hypothetical protein